VIAQAALANSPDVLRHHLELGADRRVVRGISFGHDDVQHPPSGLRTTRAPLDEVLP
jgi:hypothetical protein